MELWKTGLIESNLPEMTVSGAILIIVIVMARTVFLYKLPKKTFLVLWGIVLLRLLIPLSIPSKFSVYSLASERNPAKAATEKYQQGTAETKNPKQDTSAAEWEQSLKTTGWAVQSLGSRAPAFGKYLYERWQIIWAAGCIASLCIFSALYVKCRRKFAESLPAENEYAARWIKQHQIQRRIQIRQSDRIKVPLTYGLFHPVILMPKCTDWTNERQLAYIFTHEYIHIRRFDIITKLLLAAAVSVHWFNPFVWLLYVLCNRDLELSCDEAVIRFVEHGSKSEYAHILISMEESKCIHAPLCSSFSKNAVEERITAIMKNKKVSFLTGILATALVAGISTTLATSASASGRADTVDTVTDSAIKADAETTQATEIEMVTEATETVSPHLLIFQDEKFADYEKYGLSYDKQAGCLMYKGKKVGYFKDQWSRETYTRFIDESGEIGILVNRDKNFKITGLQEADITYVIDENTNVIEQSDEPQAQEIVTAVAYYAEDPQTSSAVELQMQPAVEADPLPAGYDKYGIRINDKTAEWFYEGRKIAALYDHGYHIYTTECSPKDKAVYLEILRSTDGSIQEVKEITKQEMQELFDNSHS